jgi:hypothetical protein
MSMRWEKLGLIFAPPTELPWVHSHAMLPVAETHAGGVRIHYNGRDAKGRAQTGTFALDPHDLTKVTRLAPLPELSLGPLGSFADNGVTACSLVTHEGKHYLYYAGWSLGVTVPFYVAIGLAVSSDGGATYQKVSEAPILGRSAIDPFICGGPAVIVDGGVFRMWYASGVRWVIENGQPKHYYHIRYAESEDGVVWKANGLVCVDFKNPDEYAISRPFVLKDGATYRMWYSSRGASYRIGYAESSDGLVWTRRDEDVGIDVSADGWDSEMIEYPHVFDHAGSRYMVYNGNGYGRTGIGLAVLR